MGQVGSPTLSCCCLQIEGIASHFALLFVSLKLFDLDRIYLEFSFHMNLYSIYFFYLYILILQRNFLTIAQIKLPQACREKHFSKITVLKWKKNQHKRQDNKLNFRLGKRRKHVAPLMKGGPTIEKVKKRTSFSMHCVNIEK
jgi:hypothetical protein